MTSDRAAERLRELIGARTHGPPPLRLADVWSAVQQWATIPVRGIAGHDADLIWLETMLSNVPPTSTQPDGPYFSLLLTRQLQHADDDAVYHGAMEQILVAVTYDPLPAFTELIKVDESAVGYGRQVWGRSGRPCPKWIAAVEADPVFRAALRHSPRALDVSQGLL